ncbi:hypothetical protein FC83_GL000652 [Agrilactobacillus composti DSM 18527 = JCM 14202]|uniref:Uncharacterized protein n=1 Tax=Agrilactobacillus composti DSM 18527 = JCM 14202 TaxID=1423734 RepID=X0PDX0_9LACO|nr:hypothetical protein [Agrilactobacillus composti]KRM31591.1 hypothetical protein FC83_GL000652 [Agrilactobacillus composti DSM 18527 = JCM 14202]GAF39378.1 hypothetical protein JCM14202_1239 [Agrilactobacillus composti DSM 18527 = JCM 14202]
MNTAEFKSYVQAQSNIETIYLEKVTAKLTEQNEARKERVQLTPYKIQQNAEKLYDGVITDLYQKLQASIKSDQRDAWITYLSENEVLDNIELEMNEMSLDDD